MNYREWTTFRNRSADRERGILDVLRQLHYQTVYLRDRLLELNQRVKALDGITPQNVPPWPKLMTPPELVGSMKDEE